LSFNVRKEKFMIRFLRELSLGYVDEDIVDTLLTINNLEDYYTTSSCSGRLSFHLREVYGNKKSHEIVLKLHRDVEEEKLVKLLTQKLSSHNYLWIKISGFIVHLIARDINSMNKILNMLQQCGIKDVAAKPLNNGTWLIVIKSPHIISMPLALDVADFKLLRYLAKEISRMINAIKIDLKIFKLCFTELLSAMRKLSYNDR